MADQSFSSGIADRQPIPGGQWIDIKRELTVGDTKQMRKLLGPTDTIIRTIDAEGNATLKVESDPVLSELAYLFIRLAGWSFRDAGGQPIPLSLDAFDALTVDQATEIRAAFNKYLEGSAPSEDAEKKAPESTASETKSERNSSSAS